MKPDALRLIAHLLVTAWVGSMWTVGYVAAPVLFASLDNRMLAGNIAGQLFSVVATVGFATAIYLIAFMVIRQQRAVLRCALFWVVVVMLVCVAAGYAIQTEMAALKAGLGTMDVMDSGARAQFSMLHGISSTIYLIQSLLGVWLVILMPSQKNSIE